MSHLIDTNILLRRQDADQAQLGVAARALIHLRGQGERLCVARQNLIEFRNVASRPLDKNGLGLSATEADLELDKAERDFDTLPENDVNYAVWRQLIAAKGVSGKQVHDARLVASMLVYGITHLLTFNGADFRRFEALPSELGAAIIVVSPADIS